jgi:hypothetical protein
MCAAVPYLAALILRGGRRVRELPGDIIGLF